MYATTKVNLKRLDYDTFATLKQLFTEARDFLSFARQMSEAVFEEHKNATGRFPKKSEFLKRVVELSRYNSWKANCM